MLKISIVTVCYNEAADIAVTLRSVAEQTYRNIEHIVQDGGSTDGTVDIVRKYADEHPNVIMDSTKDGGIYYGMNAGLEKCTGDYVIFCNGGDKFASVDVVAQMAQKVNEDNLPDIVYGDCAIEVKGQLMVRAAHGPRFIKIGMPAAHEAILYKLALVRELDLLYDTSYCIGADYKFTCQFVRASKTFAYLPMPIVIFTSGGVSTVHQWRGMMECGRARKEIGDVPTISRIVIILMQCSVLLFSIFAGPLYRFIRLRNFQSS